METRIEYGRIADHYLAQWGGLDAGLPRLVAEPEVAEIDDGYGLRNLARHLVDAGRIEDLHRLLSCEQPAGRSRLGVVNVWFDAHVRIGRVESYLDDLRLAQQLAEESTDAELATGRPATSLGRELRYALMIGCARSAADPVPGTLGLMLIEAGIWDITRALANVRLQNAIGRCAGLVGLLPVLTAQQRPAVLAEALTAAAEVWTSNTDSSAGGQALETVAPHLTAELFVQALDTIAALPDEWDRAFLLTSLVERLPASLLGRALAVAVAFSREGYRSLALEQLAPYLPAALLPEALAAAAEITDPDDRRQALAALGAQEDGEDEEHEQEDAEEDNEEEDNEDYDEDDFARLLADVRYATYFTTAIQDRAPDLTEDQLARVVIAVREQDRPGFLGRVLVGVASHLTGAALTEAFAAARSLTRMDHRAHSLVALCERLPVAEHPAVLAEALAAARAVEECGPRLPALLDVAPLLPADQRPTVLAEALVAAQQDIWDVSHAESKAAFSLSPSGSPHRFGHVDLPTEVFQNNREMRDALVRAQRMWRDDGDRAAVIAVLRPVLHQFTRRWLDEEFGPAFGAAVRDLGGVEASEGFAAAVDDSYRWWP
jgi:hypothetical protein